VTLQLRQGLVLYERQSPIIAIVYFRLSLVYFSKLNTVDLLLASLYPKYPDYVVHLGQSKFNLFSNGDGMEITLSALAR